MNSIGTWWMWSGFFTVVFAMLAIDLFVIGGGRKHRVTFREAGLWSIVWFGVSAACAGLLWYHLDGTMGREVANEKTLEYITGYLIEYSLSVDNVFVWMMLFNFFAIPAELQKRVLILGVLGAIVMRAVMIFAGVWLISRFHWLTYAFGVLLLVTGVKMWWFADERPDLERNPLVVWMRRHMNITGELHEERFFVVRDTCGKWGRYATPLFLVLVLVEFTDLIFAVDSIPAIFAITTDPFIVLTSNVVAILGLRSMYFLLSGMADRFALLKYGLAIVLVFIGAKMVLIDFVKISVLISLGVVATIIAVSIVLSLRRE